MAKKFWTKYPIMMRYEHERGTSVRLLGGILAVICCACFGFLLIGGCDGTPPTITLTATDCLVDDIKITATATKSGRKPNFTVKITVVVTCNGNPLPNAQLKVEWWIGPAVRVTTDKDGKASASKGRIWADPSGQTVELTIEGSDDTKTVKVTVK